MMTLGKLHEYSAQQKYKKIRAQSGIPSSINLYKFRLKYGTGEQLNILNRHLLLLIH